MSPNTVEEKRLKHITLKKNKKLSNYIPVAKNTNSIVKNQQQSRRKLKRKKIEKRVDTKDLLQKFSDYSRSADLDITTLVAEHINDPVLRTVPTWIRNKDKPANRSPELQQSKALLPHFKKFSCSSIKK